jgi:hypothetical protein
MVQGLLLLEKKDYILRSFLFQEKDLLKLHTSGLLQMYIVNMLVYIYKMVEKWVR